MGLSREEDILQAVIDGVPYTGSPLSRIESLLIKIAQVGLHSMKKEVVDFLPQPGEDDILYLLRKQDGDAGNWCEEYIWLDNAYELIGNTKTDLTGYATEQWVNGELASYVKSSTFDTVLGGKVDKEAGKGLFSGSYTDLTNKPTIPVSDEGESEITFNNDGSITEVTSAGTKTTEFNQDGSITETYPSGDSYVTEFDGNRITKTKVTE